MAEPEMESISNPSTPDEYGYIPKELVIQNNQESQASERSRRRRVNIVATSEQPQSFHLSRGRILLYAAPYQRQKWGESQVLPHLNWGDLFFDLFYVAATYNVSYLITDSPDRTGLLYAAGTFLPVMSIWMQRLYYDARFALERSDLVHVRTFFTLYYSLKNLLILLCAIAIERNHSHVHSGGCRLAYPAHLVSIQ